MLFRPIMIGAIALFSAALPAAPARAAASPRDAGISGAYVTAPSGRFRGNVSGSMREYLGIPYALPPVGKHRWQPPQPIPADPPGTTRDATHFGPHCAQPGGAFGQTSLSENCLFLNVFTPPHATSASRLPVMVWIHGGAFVSGESDDYNPDRFVAQGVVVVTLNYRLGLLGFFATPTLDAEAHPAVNYGLMDQQAALAWVQANIASFGGNPLHTTIFGESAGGLSVFSQLSSPLASGLFNAAIDESGAYQLVLPTLAQSETTGTATAAVLGCPGDSTTCLRSVPVKALLAQEVATGGMTVPTVDGTVLPLTPAAAFASGHFNRVPIMDGSNHDEYRLFVASEFDLNPLAGPITAAEYEPLIAAGVGSEAAAQAIVKEYPLANYPSPDLAFATLVTDYIFSCPAYGADTAIKPFAPIFTYEFADENAPEPYLPPVSFPYGSAHASELQFIWDRFTGANPPLTPAEHRLSDSMVAYWVQFAKTHQPNVNGQPLWYPFVAVSSDMQTLVPPVPGPTFGFFADHNCAFWAALESAAVPSLQRVHDATRTFRN